MIYDKNWYRKLNRSPLSPPDWVFGVVWPILYCLMTISLLLVWSNKKCFPFIIPKTIDIDESIDLEIANYLVKK